MATLLLMTVLVAADGGSPHVGPADELRAALADLEQNVPPAVRAQTRYLSCHNLPRESWSLAGASLSFLLNSVSRGDTIVRPTVVGESGGRLLRISLDDYALPAEVWERLAPEDPYWHLRTRVIAPDGSPREVFTDGGWVDLAAAAELRRLSGSAGALLRADFFIDRVATTLRGGHYYEFAGIAQREDEFYASLGIDLSTIDRLHADAGANLIRSGVTHRVRRVARRPGPLGGAWVTYDLARVTPDADPLRNPFRFAYEAGEHIAPKRNGLHLFALFDRTGARQSSVPDVIAKDHADPLGDGIIAPLLSCVRCHVEDGLRPFANDQTRLLARGVELATASAQDARRLEAFYGANLEKLLHRDREDYAEAVHQASGGLKPAEVAAALAGVYRGYRHDLLDLDRAARELGVDAEHLRGCLAGSDDPLLLALRESIGVLREQWESSFAQAALLVQRR